MKDQQIDSIIEKRRRDAISNYEKQKSIIYANHPFLQELENKQKELLILNLKKMGAQKSIQDTLEKEERYKNTTNYIESLQLLEEEKNKYIEKNNLKESLSINYFCKKCSDTGTYLNSEGYYSECDCRRNLRMEKKLKDFECNLGQRYSFDNFKIDSGTDFSSNNRKELKASIESIFKIYKIYKNGSTTEKLSKKEHIDYLDRCSWTTYIFGPSGTGKTHSLKCLLGEFISSDFKSYLINSTDLMQLLFDRMRSFESERGLLEEKYSFLLDVEVLMIDDLGQEDKSIRVTGALQNLLDYRKDRKLITIITSNILPCSILNLSMIHSDIYESITKSGYERFGWPDDYTISDIYDERLSSRISSGYLVLALSEDFRNR